MQKIMKQKLKRPYSVKNTSPLKRHTRQKFYRVPVRSLPALAFGDVLHVWLQAQQHRVKPQTFLDYQFIIDKHICPSLGNISLEKLDAEQINAFLLAKSVAGRLDQCGGVSSNYLKKITFILRAALAQSAKQHLCLPISGDILSTPQRPQPIKVLTILEQRRLEGFLAEDNDPKNIGILLSLYTGLRLGEVCGLRWKDVDFHSKTIHISHSVERIRKTSASPTEAKTELLLCDTKTLASNRIVPIPASLVVSLRNRQQDPEDFLIPGKRYPYMDPRTYQYYFQRFLADHKLRKVNYHLLRHTFASRCIESGMDMKSLSELLGHASVNITMNIYVHSSLEHKRKQMDQMFQYCDNCLC